jgi:hypothetical protein
VSGEAKRRRTGPSAERFWIALNGASCTLCRTPLTDPVISPTPEQALGFPTLEEAEQAQQHVLDAPIETVRAFL